jgi:hypothetical protein
VSLLEVLGSLGSLTLQLAAALSIYVSLALLYAAEPERLPAGWVASGHHRWGAFSRAAALVGVVIAAGLFSVSASGRAAFLVISSAILAVTTVFILLVSLWPRAMLALALISPPLIAGLVAFGGAHL